MQSTKASGSNSIKDIFFKSTAGLISILMGLCGISVSSNVMTIFWGPASVASYVTVYVSSLLSTIETGTVFRFALIIFTFTWPGPDFVQSTVNSTGLPAQTPFSTPGP